MSKITLSYVDVKLEWINAVPTTNYGNGRSIRDNDRECIGVGVTAYSLHLFHLFHKAPFPQH